MHWETLQKILNHSEPPGYRQGRPRRATSWALSAEDRTDSTGGYGVPPQTAPHRQADLGAIADGWVHRRYTVVKDAVRALTQRRQEVFVPLIHRPGEAQVDFGRRW